MIKVFEANKECLKLIPEIVSALHKQFVYTCASNMKILVSCLEIIAAGISRKEIEGIDLSELFQILQAIVETQEKEDFCMLADILEGDLEPFLQKLQMYIMNNEEIEYPDFWQINMVSLLKKDEKLYEQIQECRENSRSDFALIPAVNGQMTMKYIDADREICMHSMLDPENSSKGWAYEFYDESVDRYYVFGMGLGYHIKSLLEISSAISVVVLENRLEAIQMAMYCTDWSNWLEQDRLKIVYNQCVKDLLKEITRESIVLVHYPSLQILPKGKEREILENYLVSVNSQREQRRDMDDNFFRLQQMRVPECEVVLQKIFGKVVVVVAAGPSLEMEIENLKDIREQVVVISVGTVAKKLIERGVIPDYIVITDAWEQMYKQVEDIEESVIPLILLSTASASIVKYYKGPSYIAYQEGYSKAENKARENNYKLFQVGGSVTTLALDIAIRLKAKKIILLGADMAYVGEREHAFSANGVGRTEVLRQVPCIDGGMVYTSKNLDIYRRWIENRICDEKTVVVYNASHGARITGTKEMSLKQALED